MQRRKLAVSLEQLGGVVVSSAQLSSISAGQTVEVTTGTADGHTHLFTFLKLA
jgi:hypothetical protein